MKIAVKVMLEVDKSAYTIPTDGDIKSSVLDSLNTVIQENFQEDGVEVIAVSAS